MTSVKETQCLERFVYKQQTELLPQTFSNYFIKCNQIRKYSTRTAEDYSIHKEKKKCFQIDIFK